jgi:tRNA U38,U39,U40 pseudouridine synthase TruA
MMACAYHGWQFQDNAASVQQTIQDSWLELDRRENQSYIQQSH